jgi:hypothetical protein
LGNFYKVASLIVSTLLIVASSGCSKTDEVDSVKATLFLLDASKSNLQSVGKREQQLRERLAGAFSKNEAIYFDFIRNNYSKQVILSLVPMQTILNVRELVISDVNNERRRNEVIDEISKLWTQSISDSRSVSICIQQDSAKLEINTVLDGQVATEIARNLCVYAEKSKESLASIRNIASGMKLENAYIGSNIEGAFSRGLAKLESDSFNLVGRDNRSVRVRASIIISSDMVQRGSDGKALLEDIQNFTEEEIASYVTQKLGNQELTYFKPIVKVDGWLTTKRNFSDRERELLEMYWTQWFINLGLEQPDFDLGVLDWSVE